MRVTVGNAFLILARERERESPLNVNTWLDVPFATRYIPLPRREYTFDKMLPPLRLPHLFVFLHFLSRRGGTSKAG